MLNAVIISLLFAAHVSPALPAMEEGYLELFVKSPSGSPIRNLAITCQEQCATSPSDYRGKVRLKLPTQIHSDDWVTLSLVKRARGVDWVLISPWDDRVNIPSFSNQPKHITSVVVVRRGDKTILHTGAALQSLAKRCVERVPSSEKRAVTDEERRLVLKQQAEAVGLKPEEVDQAIREWGKKATDPHDRGIAALYEQRFPEAETLLKESYQLRKEAAQKAIADLADAAFFLGQALYAQGKYNEAVDKF